MKIENEKIKAPQEEKKVVVTKQKKLPKTGEDSPIYISAGNLIAISTYNIIMVLKKLKK